MMAHWLSRRKQLALRYRMKVVARSYCECQIVGLRTSPRRDKVMDLGLAGKHCFVTGASAGIGRSTAVALAAEGAVLSIAGRDQAALAATRDMIVAQGASMLEIIACDLSL